ncbi:leguminosin proline-rich group669 secreted peptide [Medicago truncatula]|nr:leguminosin proline-rich group669 secreted peptide [Medicago truncatula]
MSYYNLSVLVLFLAVNTIITNIAGNPKHQIHAQPVGPIINRSPTIDPETSVGLNYSPSSGIRNRRPRHRKLSSSPILPAPPHNLPKPPILQPSEPPEPPS